MTVSRIRLRSTRARTCERMAALVAGPPPWAIAVSVLCRRTSNALCVMTVPPTVATGFCLVLDGVAGAQPATSSTPAATSAVANRRLTRARKDGVNATATVTTPTMIAPMAMASKRPTIRDSRPYATVPSGCSPAKMVA